MPLVAEQAGFRDGGHLSDVSREEAGETPTAYRRRFRVGWHKSRKPLPQNADVISG
jgi:transcriptional regulator GlxA family with amidase domain